MSDTPEIMDVNEAADLLRVHPNSLRRWVRQGRIPCLRAGIRLRFRRAALLAWLSGDRNAETAA